MNTAAWRLPFLVGHTLKQRKDDGEPMVKQRKPDAAPFQADIDDFIDQAPDGRKSIKRAGRKCAITVSIDPAVLERLDNWARGRGISRAAAIAVAVAKLK
jgi:hypothetical protein